MNFARRSCHTRMTSSTQPDPRRWKALALLCTAFFMVILDSSIVLVALPSIGTDLHFSADDLQWVLSAYLLSFGGLLLLGGRLADLLGRRRMLMAGIALFGLASLACGLAWSGPVLIAARVVQGMTAAVMTPTALAIITTTFDEGAERNKALGVWASIGAIAGTAGWLIGGPITSGLGWQWIFFLNVPVAVAVTLLAPVLVRESRARGGARSFDFAGAVTITAALLALVYAVVEAPHAGWGSGRTLGLLAASAALIAAFAAIEHRSAAPLVPLRVLRSRTLVGGNLVMLTLGMAAYGMPFILTLYAQEVLGYSPVQFGFAFVVMPVMAAVGSTVGQGVVTRSGFRRVAVAAMVLLGIGTAWLTQVSGDGSYLTEIFVGLLVFGPGVGAGYVAGSAASLAGAAESEAGLASGLNNASFQIGAAVGVAIVSSVASSHAVLVEGAQAGFTAAIAFAVLGLAAAVALLGRRRGGVALEPEPAAA
jgi:EmrB/QacA subfamily drug resistance transporter